MATPLTREAIAAVDSTGQIDEVLELSEHLRDALWRVDSSGARPVDAPGGADRRRHGRVGRRARGWRGARSARGCARPLCVSDGYALPGWAGPSTLVFASSYSGNTEETLSAYDDAVERGAPRLVATTGGALVERARADGVPVDADPGRLPAAGGDRLRARRRAGGGGPGGRGAVGARRDRGGGRAGRARWPPSGGRTRRGLARRSRSRARCTARCR